MTPVSISGRTRFELLTARARRRLTALALLRRLVTFVLVITVYFLSPFHDFAGARTLTFFLLGMALFVGALLWQLSRITRAEHPHLVALEAVGLAITLVLAVFAGVYILMSNDTPAAFSEVLTKTSSLYFTVTVLSTVGFGDIVPVTDAARLVITVQMIIDLVLLGVIARVLLGAAQNAVARQRSAPARAMVPGATTAAETPGPAPPLSSD